MPSTTGDQRVWREEGARAIWAPAAIRSVAMSRPMRNRISHASHDGSRRFGRAKARRNAASRTPASVSTSNTSLRRV
jgi:hypothetical protein